MRLAIRTMTAVLAAFLMGTSSLAAPAPGGHDLILARLIGDAALGKIDYQALTPELRDGVRSQAAIAQSQLTALGALKSVTFVSADPAGTEYYRTTFEHGALDWAFSINASGLIANAAYRPVAASPF
jgi:hypothetical protein